MTNFEKYKDEIFEILSKEKNIAIKRGKIVPCKTTACAECGFNNNSSPFIDCQKGLLRWLYTEEAPTLTNRERAFCEYVQTGYIARDSEGLLYHIDKRPVKGEEIWENPSIDTEIICFLNITYADFDFIKWEDEEPWTVEDLLKLRAEE